MPLFHFALRDGAEIRDTTDLRLSDEKAARDLAERMALAVSRRRPDPVARRIVVETDGARERLVEVPVPKSARAVR